jgi:hypothetical protein
MEEQRNTWSVHDGEGTRRRMRLFFLWASALMLLCFLGVCAACVVLSHNGLFLLNLIWLAYPGFLMYHHIPMSEQRFRRKMSKLQRRIEKYGNRATPCTNKEHGL